MLHRLRYKIAQTLHALPTPASQAILDTLRRPPVSDPIRFQIDSDGQAGSPAVRGAVVFKLPWQPTLTLMTVEWKSESPPCVPLPHSTFFLHPVPIEGEFSSQGMLLPVPIEGEFSSQGMLLPVPERIEIAWTFEQIRPLSIEAAGPLRCPEILEGRVSFTKTPVLTINRRSYAGRVPRVKEIECALGPIQFVEIAWQLTRPRTVLARGTNLVLTPPRIFDRLQSFEEIPSVSPDLLVRLEARQVDGKRYNGRRLEPETDLWHRPMRQEQPLPAVRKAYTETKVSSTVTHRQLLTIWDLIYPILLPPLIFDFVEQVDLFRPLYKYQRRGIEFLIGNPAALLADEMGTGKTVMAVLALRLLFRQGRIKRALIVCPSSVVGSARLSQITGRSEGWDGHFYHWAPELSVTVVRGASLDRQKDWNYPAHVFLTTYDTLRNDMQNQMINFNAQNFDCIILDEAQNIKNPQAGRAKAVRSLNAQHRWALTGTPIENRVDDVVAIFECLKPGLFPRQTLRPAQVKRVIEPYMLRRLKRDVMTDLPPKIRQEKWLELEHDQRKVYDAILRKGQEGLAALSESATEFEIRRHIFQLLTELKQVCNFAPGKQTSPKTEALLELVESIVANQRKLLIFSQYLNEGVHKLQPLLNEYGCVVYTGQTTPAVRDRTIQQFRTHPDTHIFLATVKTAGIGLTLTEATYVVHFDHWWNPAVMWQAEDRAHRHGQTESLNVYSLWMQDTIEERIYQILKDKGLLIDSIIESLAEDAVEGIITTDEWLDMFGVARKKEGAARPLSDQTKKPFEQLSPREFEDAVREFFTRIGYTNARTTPQTRDGGIDIYASRMHGGQREEIVAQCKHTDVVGVSAARELLGVLAAQPRIAKGFLVTSGRISEECQRFCEANGQLTWIDGKQMRSFLSLDVA